MIQELEWPRFGIGKGRSESPNTVSNRNISRFNLLQRGTHGSISSAVNTHGLCIFLYTVILSYFYLEKCYIYILQRAIKIIIESWINT